MDMKRKVSRVGPATLVVSLPSRWAKTHGVKKGDEIEIIENGSQLCLNLDKKEQLKKIKLNLSDFDFMAERVMSAYYKEGYDEFEVMFKTNKELKHIMDVVNKTFIGFEIYDQKDNAIVLKKLAKIDYDEFYNIFRKVLMLLKDIISEGEGALSKNDRDKLESLILLDRNINRFVDYCKRTISVGGVNLKNNGTYHYVMVDTLETIGDKYKEIFRQYLGDAQGFNEVSGLYSDANTYFNYFSSLMTDFDVMKIAEFGNKRNSLMKKYDILSKSKNKPNLRILFTLNEIIELIFGMNDLIVMING